MRASAPRVAVLTAVAMTAFAANSVFTRLSLAVRSIDPASFVLVRLASGALLLWVLARRQGGGVRGKGSFGSALALFAYAAPFSFAYLDVPTGTGALVLFGTVQITMAGLGALFGERPRLPEVLGMALAFSGLVYLALPRASLGGAGGLALMAAGGAAWGVYSLRGRGVRDPLGATADNFLLSAPLALGLWLACAPEAHAAKVGIAYACASGALASGVGYAAWYAVLPSLGPTQAAVVQLSVPVLAALGGFLFLGESVTPRWAVAALLTLGGIGIAVLGRARVLRTPSSNENQ